MARLYTKLLGHLGRYWYTGANHAGADGRIGLHGSRLLERR